MSVPESPRWFGSDERDQAVYRSVAKTFSAESIMLAPEEVAAMAMGLRLLGHARQSGDVGGIDSYSEMIRGQAAEVGLSKAGIMRLLRREVN